jgi:cytochrome b
MGGWSVAALLLVLVAMVCAGLFAVDVDGLESGPLADWVSFATGRQAAHVHGFVFNLLLALIALHVLAIAFYRLWLKQELVWPMVTGRAPGDGTDDGPGSVAIWRVLVGVVLAGGVAWAVSRGFMVAAGS